MASKDVQVNLHILIDYWNTKH